MGPRSFVAVGGFPAAVVLALQIPGAGDPAQPSVIPVTTARVAVDFVARDSNRRPVLDLQAGDVEVLEDGVRQEIESLELIRPREARQAATSEVQAGSTPRPSGAIAEGPMPAGPARGAESQRVVAIVFDRLDQAARQAAYRALEEYVDRGPRADLVGLFSIDPVLTVLQPFTDDDDALKRAAGDFLEKGMTGYGTAADLDRLRELRQRAAFLAGGDGFDPNSAVFAAPAESRGSAGPALAGVTRDSAEAYRVRMEAGMLESFISMERDQQGLSSLNSLLALVGAVRYVPGRKAVLLFSQGLALPDRAMAPFESLVAAANRAQVSFYTVDAGGLRVQSSAAEARREQAAVIAAKSQAQQGIVLKSMEMNESMMRLSPASGLGRLAEQTGGLLTTDTNELGGAMRHMDDDNNSYYVLSYTPTNTVLDGSFRKISLRLKRSRLTVQGRSGYYALADAMPTPVLAHEAAALAALDDKPRPTAIPFDGQAFSFPGRTEAPVVVLADVPRSRWTARKEGGQLRQDGVVVAVVRDAVSRRAVRKLSQRYPLAVRTDQEEALSKGRILFYKETSLPPGRYVVDLVTRDMQTGAAGTRTSELNVFTPADDGLSVGDLIVVASTESVPPSDTTTSPLRVGQVIAYPALTSEFSGSTTPAVGLLVGVRSGKGGKPEATIDLLRGNVTVTSAKLAAGAPVDGLLQFSGLLPVRELPPAEYTLRLSVNDASNMLTRSRQFVVRP